MRSGASRARVFDWLMINRMGLATSRDWHRFIRLSFIFMTSHPFGRSSAFESNSWGSAIPGPDAPVQAPNLYNQVTLVSSSIVKLTPGNH